MTKPNETVAKRIATCRSCPELSKINTCAQCGCFMPVKVRFKWMKCPLGKWGAEKQDPNAPKVDEFRQYQ